MAFNHPDYLDKIDLYPVTNRDYHALHELLLEPGAVDIFYRGSGSCDPLDFNLNDLTSSLIGATDNLNQFLFFVKLENNILGIIGSTVRGNEAEVGSYISLHKRGKGLGRKAHQLLFSQVSSRRPNVNCFLAICNCRNYSARKMLVGLGFMESIQTTTISSKKDSDVFFRMASI